MSNITASKKIIGNKKFGLGVKIALLAATLFSASAFAGTSTCPRIDEIKFAQDQKFPELIRAYTDSGWQEWGFSRADRNVQDFSGASYMEFSGVPIYPSPTRILECRYALNQGGAMEMRPPTYIQTSPIVPGDVNWQYKGKTYQGITEKSWVCDSKSIDRCEFDLSSSAAAQSNTLSNPFGKHR